MTGMNNQGFTLFEMLITLAVAAILAAFAIPAFQNIQVNSGISSLSADVIQSVNDMRNRAVATRVNTFALQGAGSTATDVSLGTAGDWSAGWRITRGALPASSTPVAKIERSRSQDGNTGANAIRAYVYGQTGAGALTVSATGSVTNGTKLRVFGFNNFGRMIREDGTAIPAIAIVVCAPNVSFERGRVIKMTGLGRVENITIANPATCS